MLDYEHIHITKTLQWDTWRRHATLWSWYVTVKLSCETLQIFFKNPNSFSIISIGPHKEEDERVYHSYYQWVPLVLSIQAIFFYAPHWIWKQLEGGRLEVRIF